MPVTKRIPADDWKDYFDGFSKRFLRNESPEAIDVEVLTADLGDQYAAEGERLVGISYDRKSDALEFAFEGGEHRILGPDEVWIVEEDSGFPSALEIVRRDGTREIVNIQPVGLRRMD